MIQISNTLKSFIRPSEHSTYSPSSMDRIMGCPASIAICKHIPEEPPAPYAVEGTVAHSLAEAMFYLDFYGFDIPASVALEVNDYSSRDDMIEGAKFYSKVIQDYLANQFLLGRILWFGLERGIPIIPEQGAFGTADCVIVGERGAVIIDYKFGSKKVSPDSLQLKTYIAGVLKYLDNVPEDYTLTCVIVQPRVGHSAESHTYSCEEIRNFFFTIKDTIDETLKPNLIPIEGNHCFWCPASRTKDPALKCPAKSGKVFKVLENDFQGFMSDVSAPVQSFQPGVNPARDLALKKILGLRDLVNEVAAQALEEFQYRLEKGESIEGVSIVSTEGKRQWRLPDEGMYVELLNAHPDIVDKLVKTIPATKSLITVTEFEKLKGKDSANAFTIKKISKQVKVSDDELQKIKLEFMGYGNINKEEDQEYPGLI